MVGRAVAMTGRMQVESDGLQDEVEKVEHVLV